LRTEKEKNQPALFSTLVGGGEGWRTICHVMMCEELAGNNVAEAGRNTC